MSTKEMLSGQLQLPKGLHVDSKTKQTPPPKIPELPVLENGHTLAKSNILGLSKVTAQKS